MSTEALMEQVELSTERAKALQKAEEHEIAQTIIRQLGGGGTGRLVAMVGAKDFTVYNRGYDYDLDGNKVEHSDVRGGVCFKFPNRAAGTPTFCRILLTTADTYRVGFLRLRGYEITLRKGFEDVYGDQLRDVFERETGLTLTLFPHRGES